MQELSSAGAYARHAYLERVRGEARDMRSRMRLRVRKPRST